MDARDGLRGFVVEQAVMAKSTKNRKRPGKGLILINITPKLLRTMDNGLDWNYSYHLTCKYATDILICKLYLG